MRAAVLTISSSRTRREDDESGNALVAFCEEAGLETVYDSVSDDREAIAGALKRLADNEQVRFIFTTGGTGMTPDDVTPEATKAVIERDAPGFAEAMRADSLKHTPMGIVSRGVSGIAGRTLIVNFPGNPKAIGQLLPAIAPTLEHVVATLHRERGTPTPGH